MDRCSWKEINISVFSFPRVSILSVLGKDTTKPNNKPQQNQLKRTYGIGIVDLHAPADVRQLKIEKGSFPQYITWSADGRYIAYALYDSQDQLSCFAVRVNGGKQHIPKYLQISCL